MIFHLQMWSSCSILSQERAPQPFHGSNQNLGVTLDNSHTLICHMQCITSAYQYTS